MKNNITKNLIVFGVIVFSLFFYTNNVFAYTCSGYSGYTCDDYAPSVPSDNYNNKPIYPTANTDSKTTVVNNYYYPATKVAEASTVDKTSTTTEKTVTENKVNSNDLTALSVRGSNGFMPSSIWQWILVIFLILAIIIIARIIAKKPAQNNSHTAPAH